MLLEGTDILSNPLEDGSHVGVLDRQQFCVLFVLLLSDTYSERQTMPYKSFTLYT